MKAYVVDTEIIRQNVQVVLKRAGGTPVYGVIKGDGYGLGLVELARILREEGVSRFAVTEPADAARLRESGFTEEEILMLRSTSDKDEILCMLDNSVVATIGSHDAAVALNGLAEQRGAAIEAHIKVDTGMGRYGFLPEETDKIISLYRYMPNIAITGIYTHLHSAFRSEKSVRAQLDAFNGVLSRLHAEGLETGTVHAANSSAFFRFDFAKYDAVRIGSALTGRMPGKFTFGLTRMGYIESQVIETRWLPKGKTIGYGAAYKTRRPTRIAVIPVGYCDGYCMDKAKDSFRLRDVFRYMLSDLKKGLLGGALYVRVGDARARVLGHVGMLHTVIDVTGISCSAGDTVTMDASPLFTAPLPRKYI